ncbi:aromatic amino acid transaminase [Noviherbaspirillum sedimenti]|uniref:Aspartate/tyrosine/aromatic aminotransferase n=1 Tax=Noviherbaspirillum sedimenti TaxID=2320865 RepID=A0A3A3FZG2_9BURK|nr:amino acid aminotransferase [Noviherbaspirillum sedimenti]RJG01051.1 aspartate/tyrosine/aromatic aminotransferase [Noviherbaspirillum sedimenti]
MFEHFPRYPGDPIFSLVDRFRQDPRPEKVNLSIGLYYDDAGNVPKLESVRIAEQALQAETQACIYQPMAGAANYRQAVQEVLFGAAHPKVTAKHIATAQTIGGSGALKLGSDLLKQYFPESQVWVSDPSWDNHAAIFSGSGFTVNRYPYFDAASSGVNFAGMTACLEQLPARSIVLFHPCCHNPTGVDLTPAQWDDVVRICVARELIPFCDIAYQGLGQGMEEDAYAMRAMADAGLSFFVSNSFSKTFSLYGERCGALSIVCKDAEEADRVLGQMEFTVRRSYSSPPTHGGQIVARVLLNPQLNAMWRAEVGAMRARILQMRQALQDQILILRPDAQVGFITAQRGMFSYSGFFATHAQALRDRFGIYLLDSGRICITGLTTGNVRRVAQAVVEVMA